MEYYRYINLWNLTIGAVSYRQAETIRNCRRPKRLVAVNTFPQLPARRNEWKHPLNRLNGFWPSERNKFLKKRNDASNLWILSSISKKLMFSNFGTLMLCQGVSCRDLFLRTPSRVLQRSWSPLLRRTGRSWPNSLAMTLVVPRMAKDYSSQLRVKSKLSFVCWNKQG